jgi:hypothetical protein
MSVADITLRIVSQNSLLLFLHDNFSNKYQFDSEVAMYSVQNWTLLFKNLYVFGQNTFNTDLNYILKQFLAIFEIFN